MSSKDERGRQPETNAQKAWAWIECVRSVLTDQARTRSGDTGAPLLSTDEEFLLWLEEGVESGAPINLLTAPGPELNTVADYLAVVFDTREGELEKDLCLTQYGTLRSRVGQIGSRMEESSPPGSAEE